MYLNLIRNIWILRWLNVGMFPTGKTSQNIFQFVPEITVCFFEVTVTEAIWEIIVISVQSIIHVI